MVNAQSAAAAAVTEDNAALLSDKNFRHLCEFVHRLCGITLTAKKKSMVDGRLRRRMRALGIGDINDYCHFLFEEGSAEAESELVYFIDAVTTNKTDFFREPAHFSFMENHIFPGYLEAGRRNIKVWSAASSMGAEAYTIAMVIDSYFDGRGDIDYSILATDICTDVLKKGSAGRYPDSMLEPIPEEHRRRYVLIPEDPTRHEFLITRKLRSRVGFQQLNLMDDRYPFSRDFDFIFLRNVLIYFDRVTQERVLTKLCEHLRPGGFLFLGHSESLSGAKFPLDLVANTIFRRR
jgi:chemotaxis protein methyltransferase CheR